MPRPCGAKGSRLRLAPIRLYAEATRGRPRSSLLPAQRRARPLSAGRSRSGRAVGSQSGGHISSRVLEPINEGDSCSESGQSGTINRQLGIGNQRVTDCEAKAGFGSGRFGYTGYRGVGRYRRGRGRHYRSFDFVPPYCCQARSSFTRFLANQQRSVE
jgi:hypothetical protein